jgi:toxin HigB-1
MILTFGNELAQGLIEENNSKEMRAFPPELIRTARKKLAILHAARELKDLISPPGNRLERLKGELRGSYSIRINDRWRIVFQFTGGNAEDVRVEDYHQ